MYKKFISASFLASSLLMVTPVLAQPVKQPAKPKIDIACVAAAVDMREASLGSAFATFASAQSAALSARLNALHTAWRMTDGKARNAAIQTAWQAYRSAHKSAVTAHQESDKSAQSRFKNVAKDCKGGDGVATSAPADSSLSVK